MALAGCGGSPQASAPTGRQLFAQDCSACHSLIGNESLRRQGGDLLHFVFTSRQLLSLAREMPVRRPLSAPALATVVSYVLDAERRAR